MNLKLSILSLLIIAGTLSSCTPKAERIQNKIAELEEIEILDVEQKKELAKAYFDYALLAPTDSISRPYNNAAADLNLELEQYEALLECCDTFISRYPDTYEAKVLLYQRSKAYQGLEKPHEAILAMKQYHEVKTRLTPEEFAHFGVLYQQYIEKNPGDSLSQIYQLELANTMSAVGNKEGAVQQFQAFYTAFPEAESAPYAMMQAADISDKHLGDTANARVILIELLNKYPEHPFGIEAKTILENGYIGKTNAEILQHIIQKQKSS